MPIGAVVGAAVVGAGASIVTGSQAAHAQKEAAQTAADTSLQVADKNNAFAQSMYDQNAARLDPYSSRGNRAGDAIMEMLLGPAPASSGGTGTSGGSGAGAAGSGTGTSGAHANPATSPSSSPDVQGALARVFSGSGNTSPAQRAYFMGDEPMGIRTSGPGSPVTNDAAGQARFGGALAGYNHPAATSPPVATGGAGAGAAGGGAGSNGGSALDAWDAFRNSTNYQFRLNQGLDAVGTNYAANGAFESGAEKKAINDYAQNFASNELSNYMNQLYQQEALGASAASSLAGVGTNLVAQVSANNTNAGNAAANAALASGQASANNWNNIGSAISGAAGTIGGALGSSYHPSSTAGSGIVSNYSYTGPWG